MTDEIQQLHPEDRAYPTLLAEMHRPPSPLYIRGTLPELDRLYVAVIGSRRATTYGLQVVERLVRPLAERGIVIVSGLAFGIDAAAARCTLAVHGTTVAVLGSPVTLITPRSHEQLGQQIVANGGALLSEIPPDGHVGRENFAIRNRIIAGMSHATLVVEAALESGSLITARLALEENREVFAVPGPISSPMSAGTHQLLKDGARLATCADDVLEALGTPRLPLRESATGVTPDDPLLASIPMHQAIHIDNLGEIVTMSLPELQAQLALLELRGLVTMSQPGWYIRK